MIEGDLVLGREEGPAPGDDNPSSSTCRLILFGRTIRFLIDNSRFLASVSGLSFDGGRRMMLLASTPSIMAGGVAAIHFDSLSLWSILELRSIIVGGDRRC